MGLDMSVIRVDRNINLEHIYSIKQIVEDVFDWYLGSDASGKFARYGELRCFAQGLTRSQILDRVSHLYIDNDDGMNKNDWQDKFSYLATKISEDEFNSALKYVIGSIGEFHVENSHLFFDWDGLPGKSIVDSCSWSLRDAFHGCADSSSHDGTIVGDTIVRLDKVELKKMVSRWRSIGFRLWIAKWVGFFNPEAADRMVYELCESRGLPVNADISDLSNYRRQILKVGSETVMNGDSMWIMSSY